MFKYKEVYSESNGEFYIENVNIDKIVKIANTPVYVYSKKRIEDNIKRLKKAISKYFKKYRIQFPIKTNNNPYLLKIIKDNGIYADCSSPAEIYIAKKVGFDLSRSTYTGNYESEDDLIYAVNSGIVLNLDDISSFKRLSKIKIPEIISFRINPGIGKGGFEGIVTAGTDAKFGIPYEKIKTAYKLALDNGVKKFGIHMMTGSNILEPYYFAEITQKLTMIAGESLKDLGIKFEFINIGGGFGIPYTDEEEELDVDKMFKLIKEVWNDNINRYSLGDPILVVEPGRYIVGDAGVLISKITGIKKSYKNFIGTDQGLNILIRPALYKAYHRIYHVKSNINKNNPLNNNNLNKFEEHNRYFITGRICENSDVDPFEREIINPEEGDFIITFDAGAYGFVMSSNYNNRERPAEVLVDNNNFKIIREREKIEDLWKNVPYFDSF